MTATQTLTAALIYNPIKVDLDALKAALAAEPAAAEWTTMWLPTSADDPGQGRLERVEVDLDRVVDQGGRERRGVGHWAITSRAWSGTKR